MKLRTIYYIVFILINLPIVLQSQFAGGVGRGDVVSERPAGSISNFWYGTLSTAWNVAGNWGDNIVPSTGEDIVFATNATNHLVLDNHKTIGSIYFNGSNKKMVLGNFNATINGTIVGANANSYLQTTGTGTLIKEIAGASEFAFPVGNSAYNPLSITNNTGATDMFSARVMDEVYYRGTSGSVSSEPRVKRTWAISKTNPNAGSGVNFIFNWNAGEETAGITTHKLYHYDGSVWQKQTGTTSVTGTALTYSGYTGTFSPFAIGDDIVLLPITWLNFRCTATKNGQTLLHWSTTMEQNTRSFTIERSVEGQTYQNIGEVTAAGHSQTPRSYSFADTQPLPAGGYYRVRMEDREANSSYSDVCNSKADAVNNPAPLKVFPNPTDGGLYIIALEPERNFLWEVFSATGQLLAAGSSQEGKANVRLHHLSQGLYQLRVIGSGLSENHRIMIKH